MRALGEIEGRRTPDEFLEVIGEFFVEGGVFFGPFVLLGELAHGDHQGLRDVAAAVGSEAAVGVGNLRCRGVNRIGRGFDLGRGQAWLRLHCRHKGSRVRRTNCVPHHRGLRWREANRDGTAAGSTGPGV